MKRLRKSITPIIHKSTNAHTMGAKGDGTTDDLAAITALLGFNAVYFPSGTYRLTNKIILNNKSVLNISGDGNTVSIIKSDIATSLQFQYVTSDINISDIHFTTDLNNTANTNPLIFLNNIQSTNITFTRCRFSCPTTGGNAIAIWLFDYISSGVKFINCIFENIGRMGIEILNRLNINPLTTDAYTNYSITGCTFNNIGLAGLYGMGVSFSGKGSYCNISNNTFNNMLSIGIEGGFNNTLVDNNTFTGFTHSYESISCTTSVNTCAANVYTNNIDNNSGTANRWNFWALTGAIIRGNTLANGKMYFRDSSNATIDSNTITNNVDQTLYFEGASTNNNIINNHLDNIATSSAFNVWYYNTGANNNSLNNNTFKCALGKAWRQTSGSTGNTEANSTYL